MKHIFTPPPPVLTRFILVTAISAAAALAAVVFVACGSDPCRGNRPRNTRR